MPRLKIRIKLKWTFTALLVFGVSLASADQFIFFDGICEYPTTGSHKHGAGAAYYRWDPHADAVANWEDPVNFREGTGYIRIETTEKLEPDNDWKVAFSIWAATAHLKYTHWKFSYVGPIQKGKVITHKQKVADWHLDASQDSSGRFYTRSEWDWTKMTGDRGFIVCKGGAGKYRHQWKTGLGPTYDIMKKIINRITVIMVSKGETFAEPKGWNEFEKLELSQTTSIMNNEAVFFPQPSQPSIRGLLLNDLVFDPDVYLEESSLSKCLFNRQGVHFPEVFGYSSPPVQFAINLNRGLKLTLPDR